jgi:hypothetical protein
MAEFRPEPREVKAPSSSCRTARKPRPFSIAGRAGSINSCACPDGRVHTAIDAKSNERIVAKLRDTASQECRWRWRNNNRRAVGRRSLAMMNDQAWCWSIVKAELAPIQRRLVIALILPRTDAS